MPWIIEESADCGVNWRRAPLTIYYWHPRIAMLDALVIIQDEWRPSKPVLDELRAALHEESIVHYWDRAIRVVRSGQPSGR